MRRMQLGSDIMLLFCSSYCWIQTVGHCLDSDVILWDSNLIGFRNCWDIFEFRQHVCRVQRTVRFRRNSLGQHGPHSILSELNWVCSVSGVWIDFFHVEFCCSTIVLDRCFLCYSQVVTEECRATFRLKFCQSQSKCFGATVRLIHNLAITKDCTIRWE